MRGTLVLALLPLVALHSPASAAIPDPSRSGIGLSAPSATPPCQYEFRIDGGLDNLVVNVTLRDAFDVPVGACPVKGTLLSSGASNLAFCTPCNNRTAVTNGAGISSISFRKDSGRGNLTLAITAQCSGNIAIGTRTFDFSTPDLNALEGTGPGSGCEAPCTTQPVDVIDLGIWVGGLPPTYKQPSDYQCNGVDTNTEVVTSLAIWAGGLGKCFDGVRP